MHQPTLIDEIADEILSPPGTNGISESEFDFLNSLKDFISGRLSKVSNSVSRTSTGNIQKSYPATKNITQGTTPDLTEQTIVKTAIAGGNNNENALTDMVFFHRYPQLKKLGIQKANPAYSQLSSEWLTIRNNVVRPISTSKGVAGSYTPVVFSGLSSLRQNVVNIANAEYQRWGNGTFQESDPRMHAVIEEYWWTGVKTNIRNANPNDFWNIPWSAAFISYVMRKAGLLSFKFSGAHIEYCINAKYNRINNTGPVKAYRTTEVQPQVGDIVVARRSDSNATYDNMASGMKTHGDIVVSREGNTIRVIGGNVRQSVWRKSLTLDSNGFLVSKTHFTVIKID